MKKPTLLSNKSSICLPLKTLRDKFSDLRFKSLETREVCRSVYVNRASAPRHRNDTFPDECREMKMEFAIAIPVLHQPPIRSWQINFHSVIGISQADILQVGKLIMVV